MINYMDAFLSIQKVKRDLKTMTFEDAKELICGYNETADLNNILELLNNL